MDATGAILAINGAPPRRDDIVALGRALASRLAQPVAVGDDVVGAVRTLAAQGVRRVVVLPLSLALSQDVGGVEKLVRLASKRWPFLSFHLAPRPDWLDWADAVRSRVGANSKIALTAASSGDLLHDSNLSRLAWLVEQSGETSEVRACFGEPSPDEVAVAWDVVHPTTLVDCLLARHAAALGDDSLLRPAWSEIAVAPLADEEAALRDLDRRINELLPPAYQNRYDEVVPQSMGSAPLLVGADGAVAWDRMWTSFCDLALAGGPAHRGTLLEAPTAEEALADAARYETVVAEIERGIRLVTSLPVVRSRSPGWVGMRCDSEEMALWLVRAIIVENVMVRREGEVLFLPAGPSFRLEREIKNVVTVVAKTCHYWTAHRNARTG